MAPEPIQLTVYSPNVPNLTLVDMPGARPGGRPFAPAPRPFTCRPSVPCLSTAGTLQCCVGYSCDGTAGATLRGALTARPAAQA